MLVFELSQAKCLEHNKGPTWGQWTNTDAHVPQKFRKILLPLGVQFYQLPMHVCLSSLHSEVLMQASLCLSHARITDTASVRPVDGDSVLNAM